MSSQDFFLPNHHLLNCFSVCNYLTKHYKVNLNEEVLVPHLTIFLDAPDDPKGDAPSIEALAKSLNTDGEASIIVLITGKFTLKYMSIIQKLVNFLCYQTN